MTNYMPKFNASLSKEQINNIFENLKIHNLPIFFSRKRSYSVSSDSDSDVSGGGSHYHHKKRSKSRKMNEVERLAEMERQRRQKEAEQKVPIYFNESIKMGMSKRFT